MRDKERGVVWEECIILLPRAARCIFLSATIPNASQFAHWVAAVHRQPCHVIGTSHRPTPLQHWVFPAGGSGLHLVLDEAGHFHTAAFERAMGELDTAEAAKVGSRCSPDMQRLLRTLMAKKLTPAIVFAFSRKECCP